MPTKKAAPAAPPARTPAKRATPAPASATKPTKGKTDAATKIAAPPIVPATVAKRTKGGRQYVVTMSYIVRAEKKPTKPEILALQKQIVAGLNGIEGDVLFPYCLITAGPES